MFPFFLLNDKGWRLSLTYDMNPNLDGTRLKLNISLDYDLLGLKFGTKRFRLLQN